MLSLRHYTKAHRLDRTTRIRNNTPTECDWKRIRNNAALGTEASASTCTAPSPLKGRNKALALCGCVCLQARIQCVCSPGLRGRSYTRGFRKNAVLAFRQPVLCGIHLHYSYRRYFLVARRFRYLRVVRRLRPPCVRLTCSSNGCGRSPFSQNLGFALTFFNTSITRGRVPSFD
jgi:hypothetical protein